MDPDEIARAGENGQRVEQRAVGLVPPGPGIEDEQQFLRFQERHLLTGMGGPIQSDVNQYSTPPPEIQFRRCDGIVNVSPPDRLFFCESPCNPRGVRVQYSLAGQALQK